MMTLGGRCGAASAVQKFAWSALTVNTPASSQRLAVRWFDFAAATVKCERILPTLSSVVESCRSPSKKTRRGQRVVFSCRVFQNLVSKLMTAATTQEIACTGNGFPVYHQGRDQGNDI